MMSRQNHMQIADNARVGVWANVTPRIAAAQSPVADKAGDCT